MKDNPLEKAKLNPNENKTIDDLNIKKDNENGIVEDEPPAQEVKINRQLKLNKIVKTQKPKVKAEKKIRQPIKSLVSLKEIKICKNIKNRNPVGIGEIFPNSVVLYCFTKSKI